MRGLDKLFTDVAGRPLLAHAIAPFQECAAVDRIVLVLAAENVERGQALVREYGISKVRAVVPGGERRQDSVRLGVEALGQCDYVAVHDGARPLVDGRLIARGLEAVRETGAAVPAVPLADTVKEVGGDARVVRTVDRTRLWAVQTPQFFRCALLIRAHHEHPQAVTDDAALLEAMGLPVKIFPGDKRNIKVTTPEDLELVLALLAVQ
jgi:2-C-methyl-D-erythritol 4-phosphate cytidylyltransferase